MKCLENSLWALKINLNISICSTRINYLCNRLQKLKKKRIDIIQKRTGFYAYFKPHFCSQKHDVKLSKTTCAFFITRSTSLQCKNMPTIDSASLNRPSNIEKMWRFSHPLSSNPWAKKRGKMVNENHLDNHFQFAFFSPAVRLLIVSLLLMNLARWLPVILCVCVCVWVCELVCLLFAALIERMRHLTWN